MKWSTIAQHTGFEAILTFSPCRWRLRTSLRSHSSMRWLPCQHSSF